MNNIYYKVVNHNLRSAIIDHNASVKYSIGEWTEPVIKGSKLFVFNDISAARLFAQSHDWPIFKCEVLGIYKGKHKFYISNARFNYDILNRFWSKIRNKRKFTNLIEKPFNTDDQKMIEKYTVWVDKVKLIERVE